MTGCCCRQGAGLGARCWSRCAGLAAGGALRAQSTGCSLHSQRQLAVHAALEPLATHLPFPRLPPPPPQILAARKLHAYCRHCGRPVEAAIIAAGGTHMLLIMVDSLDRSLRDVCTRLLTDLAADDRVRCVKLAGLLFMVIWGAAGGGLVARQCCVSMQCCVA